MTITSELKKLHKKMTGKETDGTTIDEILEDLTVNYEGGSGGGNLIKDIDYSNPNEWNIEEEQPTAEVIDNILANKYTLIHVYNIFIDEDVSVEMYLVSSGMIDVEETGVARYYYKFDEGDEDKGTSPNIEQYSFIHQEGESAQMIVENFELGGGAGTASWGSITGTLSNQTDLQNALNSKGTYSKPSGGIPEEDLSEEVQNKLNSGGGTSTDVQINGTSIVSSGTANIVTETAYNASSNKIATMSDLPDMTTKQDTLVSGTNIKTINNTSILGSGNIEIDTDIPVYTPTEYDIDLDYDTFSVELSQADIDDIIEKKNAVIRFDFDDEIYSFNLTYAGHDDKDDTDYFVYTFNLVNENVVLEIDLSSDNGGEISNCNLIRTVQANPTLEGGEEDLESITISGTKYAVPSGGSTTDVQINGTSITSSGTANIVTETAYNASSNKIATMSDVGTNVVANPTLAGGENALESIQIGSTKYDTKGIYPVSMSIEQIPAQTTTVTTTTTVFGDMTGNLTDTSLYAATSATNVTYWDANLEPNRTGSKLKSVFIAAPSSAVNKTLSIVGSTSPVGEPTDSADTLGSKAQAAMNNYSIICTITLKEGLNEYTLDGNDANVSIVTQSMINSAPQSIGYFHPSGTDTGSFYFIATNVMGNDWGGYWNAGVKAFHKTLGINWKYEKTIEVSPAETDFVLELSNGEELSCNFDDVEITINEDSPLKDKKIAFVGDSITKPVVVQKAYWGYIQDMTSCVSIGYGIDGSTISNQTNHNPMYARISEVSINCDAVVVFGGTNDFGLDVPLGEQYTTDSNGVRTLSTNTSTFWGAVNQMCINLQDRFATKSIYLCTPIRRGTFKTNSLNDNKPNGAGKYLDEYADAIRKACEWFSFNLIDLYATSGLYPYDADNAATYYAGTSNSGDYLHPNANGHQRIAKVMKLALEKTFIE